MLSLLCFKYYLSPDIKYALRPLLIFLMFHKLSYLTSDYDIYDTVTADIDTNHQNDIIIDTQKKSLVDDLFLRLLRCLTFIQFLVPFWFLWHY